MKNKKELKIGQIVFIIDSKVNVTEEKIVAIIKEENEIKYSFDTSSCDGVSEKEIFLTKNKAEVRRKNFLDKLRFNVGDLIIFKYKSFGSTSINIGRINKINYSKKPYGATTAYEEIYDFPEEAVVLKIKNEYIEGFGEIKELHKEYDKIRNELREIEKRINKEHELLEKDLKQKFKKHFFLGRNKKKPLFEDRFKYEEDYYD